MKNKLRLESTNKKCLSLYIKYLINIFFFNKIKFKLFFLKKKKKITFLKSPHVFKKAKEHFEFIKHIAVFYFNSNNNITKILLKNKPSTIKVKFVSSLTKKEGNLMVK